MTPIARGPWPFFILALCWTWFFWILAAATGTSARSPWGIALVVVGLLGPMLGGIGFSYVTRDDESWREYWWRVIDPRRIPARWFLVILLFAPCLMAAAILIDIVLGNASTLPQIEKRLTPFYISPLTVIPFLLHVLIYGPLPEELGWRGYVLDRLQARWTALAASLILGSIWALWHLPLFFIKDMNPHYSQGPWSLWFWLFMVEVVATAVIYTWIFNNTRRSTLAAIMFHFVTNATAELINATAEINLYSTLLWVIAAITVVFWWGASTLTRREGMMRN
jgi:membrane protease YdiL (CAAX protease family)